VVAVLAVVLVGVGVAVLLSSRGAPAPSKSAAATAPAGVYARLAGQLKQQLPALFPPRLQVPQAGKPRTVVVPHAPNIDVAPSGYSCAVATGNSCSLHPCTVYAQAQGAIESPTPAVAPGTTACISTAKAPRTIPIVAR
jgi:hypothetical protein